MRKSVAVAFGLLLAGGTVWGQRYLITTVAGGGVPSTPALATSVALPAPASVATDTAGNVYFAAGNLVFKVDASGVLTRVAGSSTLPGYSGDGGVATSARLNQPSGVAVDAAGNLYIADSGNAVIRKVAPAAGVIMTVAGNGTAGYAGDGGPATGAQLNNPQGLAVDAAGNLYVADSKNNAIRKVAATGTITTVAGNGTAGYGGDGGLATSAELNNPQGVAVDGSGDLLIADTNDNVIRAVAAATGIITTAAGNGTAGYSGDGGPATSAALETPSSVAVDDFGNLYILVLPAPSAPILGVMPPQSFFIRKVVAETGVISTVAGGGNLVGFLGDGGPATNVYFNASGVAVDGAGDMYIADTTHARIRKVAAATGTITTVAGNGGSQYSGDAGPATGAQLDDPQGVAVDGSGNLFIADSFNAVIRKVAAATGTITTVAGNGTGGYSGDGGPATNAGLGYPSGVAVDGAGNLYIADPGGGVIRKVAAATGTITTVAGNGTSGQSGDGGPATSAAFDGPAAVALDATGNLYIADTYNFKIRKVTAATSIITTGAGNGIWGYAGDGGPATSAELRWPSGVALDGAGNLYINDFSAYSAIRKVAAATGVITSVAGTGTPGYSGDGGPAASAQLNVARGVALDGSGNLYIADSGNGVIRKVTAATGVITTIAGNGTIGYSGDGGPATSAQLMGPVGVAVDAAGRVYFGDNQAIRMLTPEATHALLSITSTHAGNFARLGQIDASYSLVVSNTANAGPTVGPVTVIETLPAGLTLASISGPGWSCWHAACSRDDVLSPGASYPPLFVAVNVMADAPSQVTNEVVVSGGGSTTSSATDLTTITGPPVMPVLAAPANGAAGVLVAPTLTWTGAAESYDVYFGTSSTPALVASTTGTSYAPPTLASGATYYWQIVARNSFGSTSSATWSFTTGVPATGSWFVPVAPCRVADTRNAAGPFGGPSITAASVRSFEIPQSACNIPATAQAYSLNVTVVPEGPLSYLTLWPAGEPQPLVSTLNSGGGIVVANAAIVPAGSGGAVSVYASNQTDVILDINGYFDSTGRVNSSSFYTAPPCRVADTRNPTGQFGGPSLFGGQSRDFPIPLSSCGITAAATAYSLNVTAVPETNFLAYLTAWPTGSSQPFVSTLNSWTGKVVANAALVPAGTNESISIAVTDPTDVVLDINGSFGQPGGAGALAFYPVAPCRVADTRGAAGPFGGPLIEAGTTRSFAIPASGCPVPSTAEAYSLNVTVVPEGPLSYLTAWPTGWPQPFVSTLNSDGTVVANAAIIPAGTNGAISIFVTNATHVILDINGYFAP